MKPDQSLVATKALRRNKWIEFGATACVIVMAGLGPAIHVFVDCIKEKTWMAGAGRT